MTWLSDRNLVSGVNSAQKARFEIALFLYYGGFGQDLHLPLSFPAGGVK
jgi:hypothetical protein